MKKQLLFFLLTPMMLTSITGCTSKSGVKLTYGTYITEAENQSSYARVISRDDLALRMDANSKFNNENFMLVVAPTNGCLCWANFQPILKEFVSQTHYLVYQISVDELQSGDTYGINFKQGHVSMAIIKEGKIYKQYISSPIFDSLNAFKAEVDKYVSAPNLYYVSKDQLDAEIKGKHEPVLVNYVRETCSDCQYSLPKSLYPLANNNTFKVKMLIFDLDPFRADANEYASIKMEYHLSNKLDTTFGYGDGVVPTIHYYERGDIKDATVYFNDEVNLVDGEYKVTKSFYTETRARNLNYLTGVKTPVLQGLTLNADDVSVYDLTEYGMGIMYGWKQESADKYHKPLFDAFMKKYAI